MPSGAMPRLRTIPWRGASHSCVGCLGTRLATRVTLKPSPRVPSRRQAPGIHSEQVLSLFDLPGCYAFCCCFNRVKTPKAFFSRCALGLPTFGSVPVDVCDEPALFKPDALCQHIPPISVVANARRVRTPPIFISKEPQLLCVDVARLPKLNYPSAALLMPAMTCVLATRAMGEN